MARAPRSSRPPRASRRRRPVRADTLGRALIRLGEHAITPEHERLFALLLLLVMARGKPQSKDDVVAILWTDVDVPHARQSLRQALYRLRQMGAPVESTDAAAWLDERHVDLDIVSDGVDYFARDGMALARRFGEPFLPEYDGDGTGPLREWLDGQRQVVQGQLRRSLLTGLGQARARGRWDLVEVLAQSCLTHDPLNEEATLALAEALAMGGSKVEALRMLDRYICEIGPEHTDLKIQPSALRRRLADRAARPETTDSELPLVGRSEEFQSLAIALQNAKKGRGSAFCIIGEPGMGKSRLVDSASLFAQFEGFRLAHVACRPTSLVQPLSAVMVLAKRLCDMDGSLGADPISLAMLQRICADIATQERSNSQEQLSIDGVAGSLFDLVHAVGAESPLLISIEDIHWLDQGSLQILTELSVRAAEAHCCLLATARTRPQSRPLPRDVIGFRDLPLRPLDDLAVRTLATSAAQAHGISLDDVSLAECSAFACGNPLFVCQLVTYWATEGRYGEVPASIGALLSERLDRLEHNSLRLLQCISLLGKHCTAQRLEHILALPRYAILDALEDLECRGLICAGEGNLRARHEMISEASLSRVPTGTLRMMHGNVANTLKEPASQLGTLDVVVDCANHFSCAGDRNSGISVIESAASSLIRDGRITEASLLLDQGRRLAESGPVARDFVLRTLDTAVRAGRYHSALAAVETLYPGLTDGQYEVEGIIAPPAFDAFRAQGMVSLSKKAIEQARRVDLSDSYRAQCATHCIILADNAGESELVADSWKILSDDGLLSRIDTATRLRAEIVYHSTYGVLQRALEASTELHELRRRIGTSEELLRAVVYLARTRQRLGHIDDAIDALETGITFAKGTHLPSVMLTLVEDRAMLALAARDRSAVRKCLSQCLELLEANEDPDNALTAPALALRAFTELRIRVPRGMPAMMKPREALLDPTIRRRVQILATYTQSRISDGKQPDQRHFRVLNEDFHRLKRFGDQDYPAAVLATCAVIQGQSEDARDLVAQYLKVRRERGPLDATLDQVLGNPHPEIHRSNS